ncbi:MAG TPA: peptidyl-prolyl cis-trans isomerase [Parvibaculum sp.]
MLDALRRGASGLIAKALMGLLVVSFAVWGIADIFRGYSSDTVATVGSEKVTLAAFQREVSNETKDFSQRIGMPLTPQQAREFGIDKRALSQLIGLAALDAGINNAGMAIGDDALAQNIMSDPQLMGPLGRFDRATLLQTLQQIGVSEKQFLADRRRFLKRQQFSATMALGMEAPTTLVDAITTYQDETRDAAYMILPPDAVGAIADPDEKTLDAYYQKAAVHFTRPETRDFSIMTLEPGDLTSSISVSEDDLKKTYEQRRDEFDVPEKRAVEQIPFATIEAAKAAEQRLKKGEAIDKIVGELGLEMKDVDLGTVARTQMISPAVADAAFALKKGEFSDPVQGPLGPVILHVTAITPGVPSTYEGVKDKLKAMMVNDQARSEVYNVQNSIEDARAGGSSLEDIAAKNNLKIVKFSGVTKEGQTADRKPIPTLPQFKDLLDTIYKSEPGDQIPPGDTGDGGYYWVRIDGVTAPELKPLKDVRTDVVALWKTEKRKADLDAMAQSLVARGNKGEAFDKIAAGLGRTVLSTPDIKRSSQSDTFSRIAVARLFAAPKGGFAYGPVGFGDSLIIMQVKDIDDGKPDANSASYKKLQDDLASSLQNDMLVTYVSGFELQLKPEINIRLLQQAASADSNQ